MPLGRAALPLALVVFTGCADLHKHSFTYKLWQTDDFRHLREPATNPAVAVHFAPQRKDYLVTYDSLRDGDDAPRRIGYFLGDYETQNPDRRRPRLVATNRMELVSVPVNAGTNSLPSALFDHRLTIYTAQGQVGPYALPTYVESDGVGIKTALTPLTVVGDATCVSLIAGFFGLLLYAHSGASFSAP